MTEMADGASTFKRSLPRLSLEPSNPDAEASVWLRLAVIGLGVVVGVAYFASQAEDGTQPFQTMWTSTFGSTVGINQIIALATPLILAGCAVALARWVGLWNIGVDGQMFFGAWLGTALAFSLPDASGALLIPGMLLAGMAGGALWAATPALLHAWLRVNVVVTTLLLNFVAASWILYWITGPWAGGDSQATGTISGRSIPDAASLPDMQLGQILVNVSFVLAVLVPLALMVVQRVTWSGFRAWITGADEAVARYAGYPVRRLQIGVFLASGAIGGLAGAMVELSTTHKLSTDISSNTGFFGIVVAVLAGRAIAGNLLTGLLLAALVALGQGLQLAGVSSSASLLLTGFLLVLAASADALSRYRIRVSRTESPARVAKEPA